MKRKRKNNVVIDFSDEDFKIKDENKKSKKSIDNKKTEKKKNKIKSLTVSSSKDMIQVKLVNKKVKRFENIEEKKEKDKKDKVKKEKVPKANKHDLEINFDYNGNYFYQKINESQWIEIDEFFKLYFKNKDKNINTVKLFLSKYQNLKKGEDNMNKFKKM